MKGVVIFVIIFLCCLLCCCCCGFMGLLLYKEPSFAPDLRDLPTDQQIGEAINNSAVVN